MHFPPLPFISRSIFTVLVSAISSHSSMDIKPIPGVEEICFVLEADSKASHSVLAGEKSITIYDPRLANQMITAKYTDTPRQLAD